MSYTTWYLIGMPISLLLIKWWNSRHIPYDRISMIGVILWPLVPLVLIIKNLNDWIQE